MSGPLERRLSKPLERRKLTLEASRPDANQVAIIIRRIIGTDRDEVVRAVSGDQIVDRRSDEAEDDFIERAEAEALARTDRRPCHVLLLPEQVLQ
ncbi:MAG TPA: hypothetical protein DGC76_00980 [Candidatus Accumulibacter sp.]|nr:hypothetical protein [Accumulibacter sp.]